MRRVRVKICGVTGPESARAAVDAGADAVGLVFAPSRRRVTLAQASAIAAVLPPFVASVGVFVDSEPDEVLETARRVPLYAVQLHGEESPIVCDRLRGAGLKVIKALRVGESLDAHLVRS